MSKEISTYEKNIKNEVEFSEKTLKEEDIKEILCVDVENTEHYKVYKYKIGNNIYKTVVDKERENIRKTEINIKNDTDEFVNGYKVVKTNTGGYTYRRELDNLLLSCRFDIATNFNEHGLAMVARNGKVTWMNENYELLNIRGEFVPYDEVIDKPEEFGFQGVSSFSKGEEALSRVIDRNTKVLSRDNSTVTFGFAYVKPDGKYKVFREYDGEELGNYRTINFEKGYGADFDENGLAFSTNYILFSRGGYIPTSSLREIAKKEFFINILGDKVNEACAEREKTFVYTNYEPKPRFINNIIK